MTERWQRELGKLTTLRAPSHVPSRIEEGPVGHGGLPTPSPRQRITAGVVAFGVFAGAAALAVVAFGDDGTSVGLSGAPTPAPVTVTFEVVRQQSDADGQYPRATLTVDGRRTTGTVISYEWTWGRYSVIRDTATPQFAAEDYVDVPASAPLVIDGDAESVTSSLQAAGRFPFEEIGALDLTTGQTVMPADQGRYVLEFRPVWEQGSPTFYFPIEVVAEPPVSPSAMSEPDASVLIATLDAPDDGTMPSLTFEYGGTRDAYIAQGGEWPGVNAFVLPLLSFSPALPPGATIMIRGDASDVRGDIQIEDHEPGSTQRGVPIEFVNGFGTLPHIGGSYALNLEGTWPRGTAVFHVVIHVGNVEVASPSAVPTVTPGIVPDVTGINEGDAYKMLYNADLTGRSVYEPTPGFANGVVVSTNPPAGTNVDAGSTVTFVVSGSTVFAEGTVSALTCPYEDHMPFTAHGGDQPGPPLLFRINVEGILDSDDVVVSDQTRQGDKAEVWHVVRNGEVIAVMGLQEPIEGVACRGSGVGGV